MNRDPAYIMILARYPAPGQAKTRLIPGIGPERAALLHRRMTEHVVGMARAACRGGAARTMVCFTGARQGDFRAWLGCDLQYTSQVSGDLGTRMRRAFETAFRKRAGRALLVGSDLPDLSSDILHKAMDCLRGHDIVLGPATDGGYYLIGMKSLHPELFAGIHWGTERVRLQTVEKIDRLGLSLVELETLRDIDRPEDLADLRSNALFTDVFSGKPLLSVVIPTLNEEALLGRTLDCVRCADAVEIIVADGFSRDNTRDVASQHGAKVLEISGGRAAQLNVGASVAKGRILLFLHADTRPPHGYADLIRKALQNPAAVAGAFRFQTDGTGMGMRTIERLTNFRSRFLRMPYGDQGLFIENRVFRELRGFAPLPIMEDFEFMMRLRRRGTVVMLRHAVRTSARRWLELGTLRTSLINQIMIAGFLGGVSIQKLNRVYRARATPRRRNDKS